MEQPVAFLKKMGCFSSDNKDKTTNDRVYTMHAGEGAWLVQRLGNLWVIWRAGQSFSYRQIRKSNNKEGENGWMPSYLTNTNSKVADVRREGEIVRVAMDFSRQEGTIEYQLRRYWEVNIATGKVVRHKGKVRSRAVG